MLIPKQEYLKIQSLLPILCVDCLIISGDRCLLLKRTHEPAKGKYWFPGGRIFKNEGIRDAALRKAREEVNLHCEFDKIISIEETIFEKQGDMPCDIHTVNVCCRMTAVDIDRLATDEYHDSHIWIDTDGAKRLELHPAVLAPILKCFGPD